MKITFETTLEQFKKIYLDWILSHVSTNNIYSLTTDDLTVVVSNNDVEVTVDKITVSCEVTDSKENEESEENSSEPSEPSEPGEE